MSGETVTDRRPDDPLQQRLAAALRAHYTVERQIGRGGMATVYLAREATGSRTVAIKLLLPDLAAAVGAERFRREVDIATRLQHPHILPVWHAGEAAGSLYCVMPFIEGESLRARLDREGQLPVDDAVRIGCEVAEALHYAHGHDVIHRDIKPENILLQDGHALVADFGIARAVSATEETKLTQTGMALGTPVYMSPEQAFGDRTIDGRADIYSLGCMVYELLTGEPPFTGKNAQAIMAKHAMEEMPSIRVVRASVPEHVEDAIARALAKTPADRFQTAEEFAAALRAPTGMTSTWRATRTHRAELVSQPQLPARKGGTRWLLPAGAALLAVAAAGTWAYRANRPVSAEDADAARRLAVPYFEDLSADGALAPIADGLTESLIDALTQVDQLFVASRNAVAPLRGADADSVARALGVGTIVRGSVEPARGDSVTVRVSLVDARTGDVIGRATTLRQAQNGLLALRDSVAAVVSEALRRPLGEAVQLRQARAGTANVEAWTLVRRAMRTRARADSLWRANDTTSSYGLLDETDSLLRVAESLDPAWTEPTNLRAAVAYRRAMLLVRTPLAARPWLDSGMAMVGRSLARDSRDAEALELRGVLRYARLTSGLAAANPAEARQIPIDAERDLRGAVAIDPHRASAYVALSQVLYRRLDIPGANLAAQRAYEEDAYLINAPDVIYRLFATYFDQGDAFSALQWCDEGTRRFPKDPRFVTCKLLLMTMPLSPTPNVDSAWTHLRNLRALTPAARWPYDSAWHQMMVAGAIARNGLADSARRVLERASDVGRDVDPRDELGGFAAFIRLIIGTPADREWALDKLTRYLTANPEHREGFSKLNTWWWRPLKDDPRYRALVDG